METTFIPGGKRVSDAAKGAAVTPKRRLPRNLEKSYASLLLALFCCLLLSWRSIRIEHV